MKIFKASLDTAAVILTVGITILFLFVWGLLILQWNTAGYGKYWGMVLPPVIYFLIWAFRPINYRVTDRELIVFRLLQSVHIPLKNIVSAEMIDRNKISWSIRTFGVGGVFGYFGRFRNPALGSMIWYATRKDKPVMIKTIQEEQIILTPDDPILFLEAIGISSGR